MGVQGEGRHKKHGDHDGAYGSLNSCRNPEPANHHQKSGDKAKEASASRKQDARGVYRVGPAANIADPAHQHAPTEYYPERCLANRRQSSWFQQNAPLRRGSKICCNIVGAVTTVNFVMPAQGAEPTRILFCLRYCARLQKMSGLTPG